MNIDIWVVVTSKQLLIQGGWLPHQSNFLYEVLKLKQNVRKNKVVT